MGHFARAGVCSSTSTGGRCWHLTKVMNNTRLGLMLTCGSSILAFLLACSGQAAAQQEFTVAMFRPETIEAAPPVRSIQAEPLPEAPEHRFWDRENRFLFAAVAAGGAADFAVTHANLQNGGKELNPITRLFSGSTAGLAVNFAGETGGVVALSYLFHRTGHHKLERLTPAVNLGGSLVAVAYGLSHR